MQHTTEDLDARAPAAGTPQRWPRPIVLLHWGTLGLLMLGLAAVYGRELAESRALRDGLLNLHRWAGTLIWIACCARLGLRLRLRLAGGRAVPPHAAAGLLKWAAAASHLALYALLLAVPLLGWALSSARGQTIAMPGWTLPMLVDTDPDLADELANVHAAAALGMLGLAVLHALAAAWHQVVRRDGVLASMALTRARPREPDARQRPLPSSPPAEPT